MSLGSIGAFLAVLVLVFLAGTLWYHLVEAVLARIRRFFLRRREPPAWHPLSREDREEE